MNRRGLLMATLALFVPIKPARSKLPGYVARLKVGSPLRHKAMKLPVELWTGEELATLKWEPALDMSEGYLFKAKKH